jgi:sucrose-6F-phosphate phosphohydrolase
MVDIRLLSTDLDGTVLGSPESLERFKAAWESIPQSRQPILCYNTGRLVPNVVALMNEAALPRSDYVLGGVGTQAFDVAAGRELPGFQARFAQGWSLELVERTLEREFPAVQRQPPEFLHPYKSSWFLQAATPDTLAAIERKLQEVGVDAIIVYSSQRYLDVLPKHASKGKALIWLAQHLGVHPRAIAVAGDSGNDGSMFRIQGVRGILVENAQPELIEAALGTDTYSANGILAEGVMDGLRHYGVLEKLPARPTPLGVSATVAPDLFRKADLATISDRDTELVREGYRHAIKTLHKNITRCGFSAASLEDNDVTGTDANYRAVWARDGAITVIQSLFANDSAIREAQRATLVTLLERVSPVGQIPSNVQIDTMKADYSGVGRIASIDSGLWVIIAVYNYVQFTGDTALLREFSGTLAKAMDWLAAHDSNDDGLLEIPEAGDWTDLFGHSYNVLYDETLWYRANVCFGRMLEMLGDRPRAAQYLRAGQRIRGEILDSFWPRTRLEPTTIAPSFTEQQFSLGDARYLLAQISPFGFSWRCDVWGNILAFLFNVLDVARARTAFEFMWGAGVSEPFPTRNLYPPVATGDPEWRPYFVVNFLNLPNHYHNGGIWPHIGGMWVRFIHRLGMRPLACRELVKLAELNRRGVRSDWEFNEWAHAGTGRPMGKRFQAWSAAAYLRACQELELVVDESDHD